MNKTVKDQNLLIEQTGKLSIPAKMDGSFGYHYIELEKIFFLKSNSNTTTVHFEKEEPISVTKTLKYFEKKLLGLPFLRIHESFIINVQKLYKYSKGKRKYVILTDGQKISISKRKQSTLENLTTINNKCEIPDYEGIVYLEIKSILYFEADQDKTIVHLSSGQKIHSVKNIGYFEDTLYSKPFFRIHNKYIINLLHVERFYRGSSKQSDNKRSTSGYVVLSTGKGLSVSASKKESFLQLFCN